MLVEQLQTWLFNVLPTITILLLSSVITMMIRVLWHPEMWFLLHHEDLVHLDDILKQG